MFKTKKFKLMILAATLFVLLAPFAMQVSALSQAAALQQAPHTWTCADLANCTPYNSGCSGDVMVYSGCHFYCQTGTTVSATICCHQWRCLNHSEGK